MIQKHSGKLMKFQHPLIKVTITDGVETIRIIECDKFLPFVSSPEIISSTGIEAKCIGQTGGGRNNIYVLKQTLPVWLFWWFIHRLERTIEHLAIAFVLLLQIWGLATVSNTEKPSFKHIHLGRKT